MFEPNRVTIKAGEGKNYFEAEATIPAALDDAQAKVIMDSMRAMQKDRMDWASKNSQPLGQREVASR